MKGLLSIMTNNCKVKSSKVYIYTSILKASKKAADASSTSSKTVTPEITLCADAQEEADHQNMFTKAVIEAKEGSTEGITDLVGSEITDAIL